MRPLPLPPQEFAPPERRVRGRREEEALGEDQDWNERKENQRAETKSKSKPEPQPKTNSQTKPEREVTELPPDLSLERQRACLHLAAKHKPEALKQLGLNLEVRLREVESALLSQEAEVRDKYEQTRKKIEASLAKAEEEELRAKRAIAQRVANKYQVLQELHAGTASGEGVPRKSQGGLQAIEDWVIVEKWAQQPQKLDLS